MIPNTWSQSNQLEAGRLVKDALLYHFWQLLQESRDQTITSYLVSACVRLCSVYMDLCGRAPIKRCGAGAPIRFDITVSVQILLSDYVVTFIFFVLKMNWEKKNIYATRKKHYFYNLFSN